MDLGAFIGRHGGIVRSSVLRQNGWSSRALTDGVRSGQLVRPRRGWLALPDADPYLLAAAKAWVVLSCITQARRLGLWVLEEHRPHVTAPSHSGAVRIGLTDSPDPEPVATVHWARPLVPRHPHALVDPIENVLALVAACQPFEAALAIWESALRHGHADSLALGRLPLAVRARELLDAASPFSDSGLETFFVPRLRWLGLRIIPQTWIAGHRVDFLIGDRLVVQLDGGHHIGAQRDGDNAHDAMLALMGYHVIRVSYRLVVDDWPTVQDQITRAVAQGLHRAA